MGAGAANFGGGEGPWDHASRLEKIPGLECVGVTDPDVRLAREKLARRRHPMFDGAKVFPAYQAMIAECKPDTVWIGVPPNAHGVCDPGRDMELKCAAAGIHLFIEKPLSCERPEKIRSVAAALEKANVITAVGYMFRYSRPIERMREILAETPGGARAFLGRYNCAYSEIRKAEWWDVRSSGGPIVEQATHFVDLARYLMGDAQLETVKGVSVRGAGPACDLCDTPTAPDGKLCGADVPEEFRHPRVTDAVWRFESGAVGSLNHATLLHKKKYDTEIELWGDGLRLVLQDPYGDTRLLIRRPHSEETVIETFGEDDPYLSEDEAFVAAIRTGNRSPIRSPFSDALQTHSLAWAITDAAR
ncbi:MAG: Gfo/Idh/MocA family oxidoreductase [Candidatus Sumerlaeota bacterium]|nr:Gfo/Idh/MocA family oxidoreductase [Candidatus Sumerlaeota bacterium]